MSIKNGHVVLRGNSIDTHLTSAVTLRLVLLHYLCPQQTCSTELGNLHEVVLRDAHIKFNLLGREGRVNACTDKLLHVFVTPSEGITQFLHDVSA